jgi:hypothetical protein
MADVPVVLSAQPVGAFYPLRRRDLRGVVHVARHVVWNNGAKTMWTPPCGIIDEGAGVYSHYAWPEALAEKLPHDEPVTCLLCLNEVGW